MTLVQLTATNGNPVWIVKEWVMQISPASGRYSAVEQAEITMSGYTIAVKETPEEVMYQLCKAPQSTGPR